MKVFFRFACLCLFISACAESSGEEPESSALMPGADGDTKREVDPDSNVIVVRGARQCPDGVLCNGVCLEEPGERSEDCINVRLPNVTFPYPGLNATKRAAASGGFYLLTELLNDEGKKYNAVYWLPNGENTAMEIATLEGGYTNSELAVVDDIAYFTHPVGEELHIFSVSPGKPLRFVASALNTDLRSHGAFLYSVDGDYRSQGLFRMDPEQGGFELVAEDIDFYYLGEKRFYASFDTELAFGSRWQSVPYEKLGDLRAEAELVVEDESCGLVFVSPIGPHCTFAGQLMDGTQLPIEEGIDRLNEGLLRGHYAYADTDGDFVSFFVLSEDGETSQFLELEDRAVYHIGTHWVANDGWVLLLPRDQPIMAKIPELW